MSETMAMSRGYGASLAMQLSQPATPLQTLGRATVSSLSLLFFSYMNGRYQNPKAGGKVGWDAVAALALLGTGLAASWAHGQGMAPAVTGAVAAGAPELGIGAFHSYLAKIGVGMGFDARSKADSSSASSGYDGQYGKMAGVGALSADEAHHYAK